MEAVEEGLLQVHCIPPNSKQEGIFRVLCENANGFNNRISGNQKIAKALDIKDDLDIDCLLYCEHRLNLQHKANVNNFKQLFQWEISCTAIAAHNVHEWQQTGKVQEGRTGAISFREATDYIRKVGKDEEGSGPLELDIVRWLQWPHDKADLGIQPLQERENQFRHIIPTTTPILHNKEEGPHMPTNAVLATPYRRYCKMEDCR